MNYLLKDCTFVEDYKVKSILIIDGVIKEIAENITFSDCEVIDAKGLYVSEGLLDMHVHLREPGFTYKEDIESGTQAAVMGGFTAVAPMPNTLPIADNEETIKFIIEKAKTFAYAKVYPIGSITKGLNSKQLTDFNALKGCGAVALSDDGRPVESTRLMKEALIQANKLNLPILSHCEDLSIAEGCINEGEISKRLNVKGIPTIAEDLDIVRQCLLALEYNVPVHIAHVSTKTGVDLIRHYKALGARVTAETCPHYFSLTQESVLEKGTNAKMNPPLRTKEDVKAIIEGLKDKTIDVIATDHAPHSKEEKEKGLENAPNGIIGLETALSVGITALVKPKHLTLRELIFKMTKAPSKVLHLERNGLQIGQKADLILFNPHEEYIVDAQQFKSKSKNTPYDKEKLFGVVYYTFVDGKMAVKNRKLI